MIPRKLRGRLGMLISSLLVLSLALSISACSGTTLHNHDQADTGITDTPAEVIDYNITFSGTSYSIDRNGAIATNGSSFVIIKPGVYRLTGQREGQIQVSVAKTEQVTLILDDFTLSCADSAALYIKSADHVFIEVPEGKTATLTDAAEYQYAVPGDTKPNACIYSSDDLTFRGLGSLKVTGNYNNGIGCKNDVVFKCGQVSVSAVNNGVKGVGSVTLQDTANLTVTYAQDGIKSDGIMENEGIVTVTGQSVLRVTCADDVLQASYAVTVEQGAKVYYRCEGSAVNSDGIANVADGTLYPLG